MTSAPQTADEIRTFCTDKFPKHFAAVSITEDQKGIVVHRKPGSDLDRRVRARFTGAPVVFREAEHAIDEMTRVQRRVMADIDQWRERGIKITSVGWVDDRVSVHVTPGQEKLALRLLRERYGDIIVVRGGDFELLSPYQV